MKRGKWIGWLLVLVVTLGYGITGKEILSKADMWRAPSSSFESRVQITSYQDETKVEEVELIVYVRDIESTMVEFMAPTSWKGKKMLMLKNDMWMIFPNASKPVRITPAQRLMGEIAHGDIARMNFAKDYDVLAVSEEKINNMDCYKLELQAKTMEGTTYYKIYYWVAKENYMPVKGEFFSASGRKLKEALYGEPALLAGAVRISKVIIYDAIKESRYSVMKYLSMTEKKIPSSYYNLDYLLKK
ncbi:hypothetical protein BREVNS_1534 [Brevinematales bacterium NS]|jgi:outer membrane lipoprotein-sorting protein|nr:outer membrane lipoprotein-sorting protein [Brevinematales bacterium]QJR22284.1 hypothetical protein BREVNS_1534 [Brevinematales bacterium NS]